MLLTNLVMMISCTFCILFFVHLGSRYIKLHLASFLHQCLSVFETSSAHSSGLLRTTVWVLQHMETSLPCLLTSHVFPKWETQSSEFQSSSPRISKGPVAHTSTERGKRMPFNSSDVTHVIVQSDFFSYKYCPY
jgi:hypothetical protein